MKNFGVEDERFVDDLVKWAEIIRKTFYDGGVSEIISTRRLVDIVKAFSIFGKHDKAMTTCMARFDEDVKETFKALYEKVTSSQKEEENVEENEEQVHVF